MLNFTFDARKTIIVILIVLGLGAGLSYFKKNHPKQTNDFLAFKYADHLEYNFERKDDENETIISINKADEEQLCQLPGIGPVIARRIIEHRQQVGPFSTKDELMRVKGIGPKKLKKIKAHITITDNM